MQAVGISKPGSQSHQSHEPRCAGPLCPRLPACRRSAWWPLGTNVPGLCLMTLITPQLKARTFGLPPHSMTTSSISAQCTVFGGTCQGSSRHGAACYRTPLSIQWWHVHTYMYMYLIGCVQLDKSDCQLPSLAWANCIKSDEHAVHVGTEERREQNSNIEMILSAVSLRAQQH